MIVTMKKVSIALQEKHRQSALKTLRRAGVMHIQQEPDAMAVPEDLLNELNKLNKAQGCIAQFKGRKSHHHTRLDRKEAHEKADEILRNKDREGELLKRLSQLNTDYELLKPWENFSPIDIRMLAAKGIDIRLIDSDIETRERLRMDTEAVFIPMRKKKSIVSGVLIYRQPPENGGEEGIHLPEYGLSELETMISAAKEDLVRVRQELRELGAFYPMMEQAIIAVQQDVEFEEIRSSLPVDEGLTGFTGFIPVHEVDNLKSLAAEKSWGLVMRDPHEDEVVPTLVKNSPLLRVIQPVFKLMGIFPGYHEPDISFWFLSFLSIFTAMILGDAGYGTVILILSLAVFLRIRKMTDTLRLVLVFGFTTLIWGTVTGTWFSSLSLVRDTALRNFVIPAIATYQDDLFPGYVVRMRVFPDDSMNATTFTMWISLLLGLVMILIARMQNFIRRCPSLSAIAQLGWLSIVITMYWLIMNIVLQLSPLPIIMKLALPVILGGLLVILIFGEQKKGTSFMSGVLRGLKNLLPTLLNSIGAFGDIISFIRLFAVGLVGVALSQSFNAMAPRGEGVAIVAAVLILGIGHALNLVLSSLSVLVHGVRLNVLEFSGHLDMEWAGIGFKPFSLHVPEVEISEANKE